MSEPAAAPAPAEATLEVAASSPDATVHQRIVAILSELGPIGKSQYNTQQKFHYRGHDDVMNALNPLLAKHGVYFVPRILERLTDQRATRSGGVMYEVNLHVEFTFYGADGSSIVASTEGEGTDSGDKATNKAHTMALKNVLAIVFAISTAEMADTDGQTNEATTGRASAGGSGGSGRGQQERREQAKAQAPVPPANWKDALTRFDRAVSSEGSGAAWLEELLLTKNGVGSLAEIESDSRRDLLTVLGKVVVALESAGNDPAFADDLRTRVSGLFMDAAGVALTGPAWRLSPSETTLPTREEVLGTAAAATAPAEGEAPAAAPAAASTTEQEPAAAAAAPTPKAESSGG